MNKKAARAKFHSEVDALRRTGMTRGDAEAKVSKAEGLPGLRIGELIQYYEDGWRAGHIAELPNKGALKIQPISARKGKSVV